MIAFSRFSNDGQLLLSITNFSPVPHHRYRLPLPDVAGLEMAGVKWREVINTDDLKYGGSNLLNELLTAEQVASHGRRNSLLITLAPLATHWFAPLP